MFAPTKFARTLAIIAVLAASTSAPHAAGLKFGFNNQPAAPAIVINTASQSGFGFKAKTGRRNTADDGINCDIESHEECEKIVICTPNCSTEHMQGADCC